MPMWTIQVADLGDDDGPAVALADELTVHIRERLQRVGHEVNVLRGGAGDIDDARASILDAVVLVLDDPRLATPVNQFAASLEEQGILLVVVATSDIETDVRPALAGLAMAESDPAAATSMLAGMLHTKPERDRLEQELTVARRYHGGLSGEITRMHDELQLAAVMQRELLPLKLPAQRGVSIATLWRPAAYVSGDIYACHQLDEDRIGIFLVDCVGHGVPAALMTMSVIRSFAIHGLANRSSVPPHEVVARINQDMTNRRGTSTRFATGVYAVVDTRAREMEIAVAGHPPALVFDADGNESEVDGDGPLLGVFRDAQFTSRRVPLPDGATMLLYSDGFEQAITAGGRRGDCEAYRRLFTELAPLGEPERMIEHVEQALDRESGSLHQDDDVTLLAIRADADAAGSTGDLTTEVATPGRTPLAGEDAPAARAA